MNCGNFRTNKLLLGFAPVKKNTKITLEDESSDVMFFEKDCFLNKDNDSCENYKNQYMCGINQFSTPPKKVGYIKVNIDTPEDSKIKNHNVKVFAPVKRRIKM